ncbi:MAG: phenylalanine--tRNA ligase subunit beta, partial [Duodenibacillus sp.]|nr:phenylalanine--tRNA ligase subunit beta [Duodenibacillus sp.]
VVVPADVTLESIEAAVEAVRAQHALGGLVNSFRLFDLYRPKDGAEKSMAFRLVLNTLGDTAVSEEDAEKVVAAVVEALGALGVKLRA